MSCKALVDAFNQENFQILHGQFNIIGALDDNPNKKDLTIYNVRVIGNTDKLLRFARLLKINHIVIAISDRLALNKNIFPQLIECQKMNISISYMDSFYEHVTGMIPINHVEDKYYLRFPLSSIHTQRLYILLTRTLDLIFGFIGTLLMLLFVPIISILNVFWSKGPLFYKQTRVGKDGKLFEIIKFRSMVMNAEAKSGAVWAQKNDPRITPIGNFLRKTRLDELPQFLNVLKGEMSLIGPRPERPFFVDELKKEIPFYDLRHLVKPGITGWAQAMYKYASDKEDTIIKLQYDLYYIKNRTILLNLKILLITIRVVFVFKGT
jgi:exopolysaccharide biosynthesis polyprenyl glycosylphosphotransferase